jgi:hypothetical protein
LKAQDINRELDHARAVGPVKDIVIPPCPELLVQLQTELNQADPDPGAVAAIAGSDVAMTAALIRIANSPVYARREPVGSVAQAVSMLGMKPTASLPTGFLLRNAIRIDPAFTHFASCNFDQCLKSLVFHMDVRWRMVVVPHANDDSEKDGEGWHSSFSLIA